MHVSHSCMHKFYLQRKELLVAMVCLPKMCWNLLLIVVVLRGWEFRDWLNQEASVFVDGLVLIKELQGANWAPFCPFTFSQVKTRCLPLCQVLMQPEGSYPTPNTASWFILDFPELRTGELYSQGILIQQNKETKILQKFYFKTSESKFLSTYSASCRISYLLIVHTHQVMNAIIKSILWSWKMIHAVKIQESGFP